MNFDAVVEILSEVECKQTDGGIIKSLENFAIFLELVKN